MLKRFIVKGRSMEPSYKDGDTLVAFRYGKIQENDVVVFKKNAMTMIKRVQKIEKEKYYVRGDNWKESEGSDDFGLITREEIIGKVLFHY
ncbi:MAG: S26 family signal peptidase [Patescibacteria group bacterium]